MEEEVDGRESEQHKPFILLNDMWTEYESFLTHKLEGTADAVMLVDGTCTTFDSDFVSVTIASLMQKVNKLQKIDYHILSPPRFSSFSLDNSKEKTFNFKTSQKCNGLKETRKDFHHINLNNRVCKK